MVATWTSSGFFPKSSSSYFQSLLSSSSPPSQSNCFSSQPRGPTPIAGCGKVEGGRGKGWFVCQLSGATR